jgi:colanic acid/amylovoran biosynthesis glycosyltransferase
MARIGHLIRSFLAPTETFIYELLLRQQAHTPLVFTRQHRRLEQFPFSSVFAAQEELAGGGRLLSAAAYRGLRWCAPPERRWLVEALRRERVDLLHAHFGPDARYFLPALRQSGLPLVVSFHGYDATSFPRQWHGLGAWYLRPLWREATRVTGVSRYMVERLAALGCPREKLLVHHVGIDVEAFRYEPRRAPDGERITLLTVVRLVPKKGVGFLLEALARPALAALLLEVLIAGDGPLRASLEQQADRLGLGGRVSFLGGLPHREIMRLMGRAQLYVQPSVTPSDGDQEGVPTTLMEAMATGLPVVATRHSGIPELVEDGASGLLVPEYDVDALADALVRLVNSPGQWAELGRKGRAMVEADFNAAVQGRRMEALYAELLRRT